jgi:hypothetical protein
MIRRIFLERHHGRPTVLAVVKYNRYDCGKSERLGFPHVFGRIFKFVGKQVHHVVQKPERHCEIGVGLLSE